MSRCCTISQFFFEIDKDEVVIRALFLTIFGFFFFERGLAASASINFPIFESHSVSPAQHETWNFQRAKTARINDLVPVSYIDQFLTHEQIAKVKEIWMAIYPSQREIANLISHSAIVSLFFKYKLAIEENRKRLIALRRMQYELVARFVERNHCPYDCARRAVNECFPASALNVDFHEVTKRLQMLFSHQGLDESSVIQCAWLLERWKVSEVLIQNLLHADPVVRAVNDRVKKEDLHQFILWLYQRLYDLPSVKRLDLPTIVFLSGASGVGKSTIAKHVSSRLNLKYLGTDEIREIIRSVLGWVLGEKNATTTFPELYGSSFEGLIPECFYVQSLLLTEGVRGVYTRTLKEGSSILLEGVSPVFWFLSQNLFAQANVIPIVVVGGSKEVFADRLRARNSLTDVNRGGADRYLANLHNIEITQDLIVDMAHKTHALLISNREHGLDLIVQKILKQIHSPTVHVKDFVDDPLQNEIRMQLHQRKVCLDLE